MFSEYVKQCQEISFVFENADFVQEANWSYWESIIQVNNIDGIWVCKRSRHFWAGPGQWAWEEVLCMVKAGDGLMVSLLLLFQTSHEVGSGEEVVYGESGSGTHGVLVVVSDVP